MFGLRMPELLIILLVVVLVFGAKRLPQLGETLGKGMRAFRNASEKGFEDESSAKAAKTPQELPDRTAPLPPSPSEADRAEKKV